MAPSDLAPRTPQGRSVLPLRPGALDAATSPATSPTTSPATSPGVQRLVLSVAEAAQLLGVSEWFVLQQVRRGLLPRRRMGRRIVISRDRLLAWVNNTDADAEADTRADMHMGSHAGAPERGRR